MNTPGPSGWYFSPCRPWAQGWVPTATGSVFTVWHVLRTNLPFFPPRQCHLAGKTCSKNYPVAWASLVSGCLRCESLCGTKASGFPLGSANQFCILKKTFLSHLLSSQVFPPPPPPVFNLYAEYMMRNAGLDEAQAGIKVAGRNINNLRHAADTTLMAESEEMRSLLMKVS